MKRSLIHEVHKAIGAVFTACGDWQVVAHYGAPQREYLAARQSCAMLDLSHRGRLRISGDDRALFLHGMLTNDIRGLGIGKGVRAASLDRRGRLLGDMTVYALDGWMLLDMAREACPRVRAALEAAVISEDVDVRDMADAWGMISLQGPETAEIMAYLGIGCPPDHEVVSASLGGHPVLVAGSRRADVPGLDLFVTADALSDCWNSIAERGARPAGMHALNVLRTEAGVPWYGVDLDDRVVPLDAGIDEVISYTKGCYVGQEVISRIHHLGRPAQQLRGVVLKGQAVPEAGAPVLLDGTHIGRITSAVASPALGRPIALAFLRRGHTEPGLTVAVGMGETMGEGETVCLPFVAGSAR